MCTYAAPAQNVCVARDATCVMGRQKGDDDNSPKEIVSTYPSVGAATLL